uniref:DUF6089 family protein n=1 Tax=Roseihalotalea indica TaxID=2867963 RepID=A0AA49GTB2_9BACT|nr:DUF6089 family protein [Tunicatimonas sp. TK19036]
MKYHRGTLCTIFFIVLMGTTDLFAQKNEIGAGIGGTNYTGDIVREFGIRNTRPGGFLLYRRNFNDYFSLRGNLMFGGLHGSDTPPFDALAQQRDTSFSTFVIEFSALMEYHFLDYKKNINLLRWSPYFFLGAGVSYFSPHEEQTQSYSRTQPVIPLGLGFKYILNRELTLSAEAGIRKTFFDYIDNISDSELPVKNYEYGNRYDKDWYYFIGVSLSYTFWTIPCPYQFN